LKIIFFPQRSVQEASSRYRVYYLAEKLQNYIDVEIVDSPLGHSLYYAKYNVYKKILLNISNNLKMFSKLLTHKHSIFVFQRGEWQKGRFFQIGFFKKSLNRNIIFDLDDAIFLRNKKVDEILALCDIVFAGSHFIRDYVQMFNDNVYLIPTCIDTKRYKIKKHIEKSEISIGWIGSPSTIKYLNLIKNPLEKLGNSYNIRFVVIGANNAEDRVPKIRNVNMEIKDWKLETEWDEIKSFDIGVMPLFNGDWERGKCAFKAMQYMVLGIPAVCSSVGEANYLISSGNNGFLCADEKEWMDSLEELIIDHELRNEIGHSGRKKIEEEYDISKTAKKVSNIIKSEFGDVP